MARWTVGMAMLFAVGAAPMQDAGWTGAPQIDVTLSSFKFAPATITLKHGERYVLHLTNAASGGHDFVAKPFFAAATIAPEDRAKLHNGGVELDGGDSADIRLVAPAPGSYEVHCSHFMHSAFGMKGAIVVE